MPGTSKTKSPRGYEIEFDEATHTYTTLLDKHFTDTGVIPIASGSTEDGRIVVKYTSGTTFVHGFFPKFDEDGSISARVAAKRGVAPEQVKAEWKANCAAACEFGTRVHETAEDVLNGRAQFRNAPRDERERKVFSAAWSAAKSVLQRMDVVGVEKIVFDVDTQIAGTIDLLAIDKSDGTVWILDWKTNKSIDFKNDYPTNSRGLRPIKHLHNCNAVQYGLQLELYDWLLRTGGYIPRDAQTRHGIFHLTEDGPKFHELPRYESEIRDMMIVHLLTREVL